MPMQHITSISKIQKKTVNEKKFKDSQNKNRDMTNSCESPHEKFKFAFIVCVYNVEKYLQECIDSIFSQTYKNYHIFAVDDGSTDKFGKILDEFATSDSRITIIHQQNKGISSSRNLALDLIEIDGSYDFVCFIDSDDYISPNFLEFIVNALLKTKVEYAVCGRVNFDKTGIQKKPRILERIQNLSKLEVLEHYFKKRSLGQGKEDPTVGHGLVNRIFSTKVIRNKRFDSTLRAAEDINFFLDVYENISSGVLISDILYFRRMRSSSITNTTNTFKYDWVVANRFLSSNNLIKQNNYRRLLEQFLIDTWWNFSRHVYQNSPSDCNKKLTQSMFEQIKNTVKIRLYARKFILFKLGSEFLRFYFNYMRSKRNIKLENYYE